MLLRLGFGSTEDFFCVGRISIDGNVDIDPLARERRTKDRSNLDVFFWRALVLLFII
jgi:hypothetical protein